MQNTEYYIPMDSRCPRRKPCEKPTACIVVIRKDKKILILILTNYTKNA